MQRQLTGWSLPALLCLGANLGACSDGNDLGRQLEREARREARLHPGAPAPATNEPAAPDANESSLPKDALDRAARLATRR